MVEVRLYAARDLENFCLEALEAMGVSKIDSATVAACLLNASLHGVDTHGIARLPTYMRRIAQGAINAVARPAVVGGVSGACAVIDGDNALGPVTATAAMAEAIKRAKKFGVSYVTVRGSNHFSYAGYYCEQAAAKGLIGMCSSGGEPTVAPWGGVSAFFTNSPLALAAPTSNSPIVVDLATSVSSRGNILLADLLGNSIPSDWALDSNGDPTTDAAAALKGSVLPLGGAKGYALIVALEVLNSILAGGSTAPDVGSQAGQNGRPADVSHFFLAIDPDSIMERHLYLERIDLLAAKVQSAPARNPLFPVRLPGDRRREIAGERAVNGIPVPLKLIEELNTAGKLYAPAMTSNL